MPFFRNIKERKPPVIYALAAFLTVIVCIIFIYSDLFKIIRFELSSKESYKIGLRPLQPGIEAIAAEPQNRLFLEVAVTGNDGNPVPAANVLINETNGLGRIEKMTSRTSDGGKLLFMYYPPDQAEIFDKTGVHSTGSQVNINARITGSDAAASVSLKLVRVPVIFIHGYYASSAMFKNFNDYMVSKGFLTSSFEYESENGVITAAWELDSYLDRAAAEYSSRGILAGRFDIISHSMGGLVARYYTCSNTYALKNNISKIIFLSTPQRGSPFASLGLKYYSGQGIRDLIPESDLYTTLFPAMLNGGLNNNIRTASILGQYDEVVSQESASLEKWHINTEIFNVGQSNFTMESLLTGKIVEASNHKAVLDNARIYNRVVEFLLGDIRYPRKIER